MSTTQVNQIVARLAITMLDGNISLKELRDAMFIEAAARAANTTEAGNLLGISMKGAYNIRTDLIHRRMFRVEQIGSKRTNDRPIELNTKKLF